MKAPAFLAELRARDVRLWVEGNRLGYEAPPGVLRPQVLAAMEASKRELLALLQAEAQVDGESAIVEITRPDIRARYDLPPLDSDPPDAPPAPPAWGAVRAVWVRDLGVWSRGERGGMIPTAATRANVHRLLRAQKAAREREQVLGEAGDVDSRG